MTHAHVTIPATPLAPGVVPVTIRYRHAGSGSAVVILHGGWGYAVYPFDRHVEVLARRHRVVIPDRTGYGGSGTLETQAPDFHQRAAEETLSVMDALSIDRASLWGHSDGAVIALRMALTAPARVRSIVAEAAHFFRRKPRSRAFFEMMRDAPEQLGARVLTTLKQEHGERWRALISTNGSAWLQIADAAPDAEADLYDGRLHEIGCPVMVVHGSDDPRTEPGEVDALVSALGASVREVHLIAGAGHSPHSERASADAVGTTVSGFLA